MSRRKKRRGRSRMGGGGGRAGGRGGAAPEITSNRRWAQVHQQQVNLSTDQERKRKIKPSLRKPGAIATETVTSQDEHMNTNLT